jgi:multidrug efflux pump
VALTLTPSLAALLLSNTHHEPAGPFRIFNRAFGRLTGLYEAAVTFLLRRAYLSLALVALMLAATAFLFMKVPSSLVPQEDQGYVLMVTSLPPASSLSRTKAVQGITAEAIKGMPEVQGVVSLSGFDILSSAQRTNAGVSFITLKDWSERTDPKSDARRFAPSLASLNGLFRDGMVIGFNPPPIQGISTTGGFELYLQSRSGASLQALAEAANQVVAEAAKRPELTGVSTQFSTSVPQYRINVDRDKAKTLGVSINTIFETMQSGFGSLYVNDFTLFGRTYRVSLSSESDFRSSADDLRFIYVRSDTGAMIPLNTLLSVERIVGPDSVDRFNIFPSAKILGNPAPGFSSGQSLAAMQDVVSKTLGADYSIGWTGSAYQEISTAGTGYQGFIFGLIMVFLILAAQYERWSLPLAVLSAVPFALFGAILAIWMRGLENDIYFQIGLVTLIGLAAKNAILIVEFAAEQHKAGLSVFDAAVEAARLRFRPIVMTSLAFILGVLPLAISTGAGSASRHSIGTGVIGGMVAATGLAIILVPLFYKLLTREKPAPQTSHRHIEGDRERLSRPS